MDAQHVVLTAVKKTEGDGLIIRFYEWAGEGGNVTLTVPAGATGATLVNLMEKPEGSAIAINGNKVTVTVTSFVGLIVMFLCVPEFQGAAGNVLGRMGESMEAIMRAMEAGK